jgi:hypothetical protein
MAGGLSRLRADIIDDIEAAGGIYSKTCNKKANKNILNTWFFSFGGLEGFKGLHRRGEAFRLADPREAKLMPR